MRIWIHPLFVSPKRWATLKGRDHLVVRNPGRYLPGLVLMPVVASVMTWGAFQTMLHGPTLWALVFAAAALDIWYVFLRAMGGFGALHFRPSALSQRRLYRTATLAPSSVSAVVERDGWVTVSDGSGETLAVLDARRLPPFPYVELIEHWAETGGSFAPEGYGRITARLTETAEQLTRSGR